MSDIDNNIKLATEKLAKFLASDEAIENEGVAAVVHALTELKKGRIVDKVNALVDEVAITIKGYLTPDALAALMAGLDGGLGRYRR